jgi:hypothetical protein
MRNLVSCPWSDAFGAGGRARQRSSCLTSASRSTARCACSSSAFESDRCRRRGRGGRPRSGHRRQGSTAGGGPAGRRPPRGRCPPPRSGSRRRGPSRSALARARETPIRPPGRRGAPAARSTARIFSAGSTASESRIRSGLDTFIRQYTAGSGPRSGPYEQFINAEGCTLTRRA